MPSRLLPVLTVAILSASCQRAAAEVPAPAASASATAPRASLAFARVATVSAPRTLEVSGSLAAWEESAVAVAASGVVREVRVDVGDRVKRGDVLVTLDGRDAALRLAAARALERQQRAALGLTEGGAFSVDAVPDVKAAVETEKRARREAERARRLLEAGVLTEADTEAAETQASTAAAMAEKSRYGARQAHAALAAARAQASLSAKVLGDMRLLAPFDGAVAARRVSAGEYAPMGSVAVVVIADDRLRLQVSVPETAIAGLQVGADVTLTVAAFPGRSFAGKLTRLGAALDPGSRTLPLEAEVPNQDRALRPGLFVRARIALPGAASDALVVPEAAIGSTGSASRVFVRAGNRVEERLVVPGRLLDGLREVTGSLRPGDEVAVEGVSRLADGDPVEVRSP